MKKIIIILFTLLIFWSTAVYSQPRRIFEKDNKFDWIQTARIFLLDAYQPPFAPVLEYDAGAWAEMMVDMNVNVIRFGTMGKYATIQGVRFSMHPDQGDRDFLLETIEACKPKGIKVVAYISTGHKLAWSMVTEVYPEYAQQTSPDGLPSRSHRNEYYLAPVENVKLQIRIPDNKRISNVSTLVKTDYIKEVRGQTLEVFFPRVEAYQAIVVKLEDVK